jgi:hypothetical protein
MSIGRGYTASLADVRASDTGFAQGNFQAETGGAGAVKGHEQIQESAGFPADHA